MNVESFVFYRSFFEAVKELPDDQRVKVYDAICEYGLNHKEIKLDGMSKAMFSLMKPSMDYCRDRRLANIENGKKGAKARWGNRQKTEEEDSKNMAEDWRSDDENMAKLWREYSEEHSEDYGEDDSETMANSMAKSYLTESESESENEYEYESGDRGSRGKRFVKPTVDEVRDYCESRNNGVDPEEFVDFYTSKGWKVGSQPMKDWKACVRTWEKKAKNHNVPREPDTTVPVYDASHNVAMSDEDIQEILKEMRRA